MKGMKILLAVSDRDFLKTYEKLLKMDGHEVSTAFDGAQAIMLVSGGYDMILLEDTLPCVNREQMLRHFLQTPVITLLSQQLRVSHLLRPQLPHAFLSLPFTHEELLGSMDMVLRCLKDENSLQLGDVQADVSRFCFHDSPVRLTGNELELIRALDRGDSLRGSRTRSMVLALNEKLRRMGKGARIEYSHEKGYHSVVRV